MGNEVSGILFGGAKVFNVEKHDVKYDAKNKPIYCVWLKGGLYAEYPEQTRKDIKSYFATDVVTGYPSPITEKTFKSNKTKKDDDEFKFEEVVETNPSISSERIGENNGKEYYDQIVDGFEGIKIFGTQHCDNIYLSNITNAEVIADNDAEKDEIRIMINCKGIKTKFNKGLDTVAKWIGYDDGHGYLPKYKKE